MQGRNTKSRYEEEGHEEVKGSPTKSRWSDSTTEEHLNYAGLVWLPQAQNYNPCLVYDLATQKFKVPPSLPKRPGYSHLGLLIEHMDALVEAQGAVGRLLARKLGKMGSGFFITPQLFITRSHMWETDLEFENFADTDEYFITLHPDATVDTFEFENLVLPARLTAVNWAGDIALFKVFTPTQHALDIPLFDGQLSQDDVLVSIGYNGTPSQAVLNNCFDALPSTEKPDRPPPIILAMDLLSPHRKTAAVGRVVRTADKGLVYIGSTLEKGASGSPVFLLQHQKPIRLVGMVLGGAIQLNGNKVTLFSDQADIDFINKYK